MTIENKAAEHEALIACHDTGQMSEKQLTEHLKDKDFAAAFEAHQAKRRSERLQ